MSVERNDTSFVLEWDRMEWMEWDRMESVGIEWDGIG